MILSKKKLLHLNLPTSKNIRVNSIRVGQQKAITL